MATEFGWLIEKSPNSTPGPEYYQLNPELSGFWTLDRNDALRFARKVDAERHINYLGIEDGKPVEHGWDDGQSEAENIKRFGERLHEMMNEAARRINETR